MTRRSCPAVNQPSSRSREQRSSTPTQDDSGRKAPELDGEPSLLADETPRLAAEHIDSTPRQHDSGVGLRSLGDERDMPPGTCGTSPGFSGIGRSGSASDLSIHELRKSPFDTSPVLRAYMRALRMANPHLTALTLACAFGLLLFGWRRDAWVPAAATGSLAVYLTLMHMLLAGRAALRHRLSRDRSGAGGDGTGDTGGGDGHGGMARALRWRSSGQPESGAACPDVRHFARNRSHRPAHSLELRDSRSRSCGIADHCPLWHATCVCFPCTCKALHGCPTDRNAGRAGHVKYQHS